MRAFLNEPVQREADIERLLVTELRYVELSDGSWRVMTLPKLVWQAHDFIVRNGIPAERIVEYGEMHNEEHGFGFDLGYVYMIHYVANKFAA